MNTSNMSHIVVGCGGSGARSARQLAVLMSKDPYWGKNIQDAVFFLLIDTDEGDLEKNSRAIRDAVSENTYVGTLHTTRGFSAPYEIVEEFRASVNSGVTQEPSSLARFSEHWWTRHPDRKSFEDAQPFMIPQLDDVTTGAGQIPMVSFLATWFSMKDNHRSTNSVEKALKALLDRIGNSRAALPAGTGSPLDSFNIMFMGSVAGGTGRGCSIPIAFKMKEMFAAQPYNKIPTIIGYFLNEDCFETAREDYEVLPQMMNAMTGWSELSAWIEQYKHREGAGYHYSLPGLKLVEDSSYDALGKSGVDAPSEKHLARPFDAVGVICRTSGSGFNAHRDQIYDMVAVCAYMDITESQIKSRLNNRGSRYFSVGSSIVEVPYEDIEHFFVDKARLDAAIRVTSELATDNQIASEAAKLIEFIGFGENALEELLKPSDDAKSATQKLVKELAADKGVISDRSRKLIAAMEDQDAETATKELKKLLSEDALDNLAHLVGGRFTAILGDTLTAKLNRPVTGIRGIVDEVVNWLVGSQDGSLLARTGSARVVAQVAQRTANSLAAMVDTNGGFSDEAVAEWKVRSGRKNPLDVLEVNSKRNGWLGLGKRFSAEEIDEVSNVVAEESLCLCARALSRALASSISDKKDADGALGLFKAIGSRLMEVANNGNIVCESMKDVLVRQKLSAGAIKAQEVDLFAGEQLERSIPTMIASEDPGYLLRRRVRPVMPGSSSMRLESKSLIGTISDLLQKYFERKPDYDEIEMQVTSPIGNAIRSSRYMFLRTAHEKEGVSGTVKVPIVEAFTLRSVLHDLAKRWPPYLSELRADNPERFEKVERSFRNFFGMNLDVTDEKVSFNYGEYREKAGEDYLMLGMATIAARTCRPFWHTSGATGHARRVTVQIPLNMDSDKVAGWKEVIGKESNLQGGADTSELVEVISSNQGETEGFNPYVLIVYANSGVERLDEVTSLDAWSKNPTIRNALALAESTETLMPFHDNPKMWPGYRGSGFTDPIYVTNRELASFRWRPWADKSAEVSVDSKELMLALVYGWVGPEWFLRQRLEASDLGPLGTKTRGPVFKFGVHASIMIARKPGFFTEGYSPKIPLAFPWKMSTKFGLMLGEDEKLADNLDGLLSLMSTDNTVVPQKLRLFRDELINEYRTFFREVGDPAGFDPVHDHIGYGKILDALTAYVNDRLLGKLTDPEHPASTGIISDEDIAEGSQSSRKFWEAIAEAISAATDGRSARAR